MADCKHYREYWEEVKEVDDWTDEVRYESVLRYECLEEDIDLHRTKCRACGHIGYYSNAAREYYENGKKSPGIKGLE